MSIRVMTHVWATSPSRGSSLLVLLAVADYADDDGRAFPSMTTLAQKARLSRRHAQRVVHDLEDAGQLLIEWGGGRGRPHVFWVVTDWNEGQIQARRNPDPDAPNGGQDVHVSPQRVTPATERVTPKAPKVDTRVTRTISKRQEPSEDMSLDESLNESETQTEVTRLPVKADSKTSRSPGAVPSGKSGQPRPRDLHWEALEAAMGYKPATRSERGAWNRALKELKEIGANPVDIVETARLYRTAWPEMDLTPNALAKWWNHHRAGAARPSQVLSAIRRAADARDQSGLGPVA